MCSKSCGSGMQSRSRQCNNPAPAHGGKMCQGQSKQTRQCNSQICPSKNTFEHHITKFSKTLGNNKERSSGISNTLSVINPSVKNFVGKNFRQQ